MLIILQKSVKTIPKSILKINTGFNEILREFLPKMQFRCESVVNPLLVRSSYSLKSEARAKAERSQSEGTASENHDQ